MDPRQPRTSAATIPSPRTTASSGSMKLARPRGRPPKAPPPWLALCQRDEQGRIYGNLANALIGLRNDPAVTSAFTFDEMAQTAMIIQRLPVATGGKQITNDPFPQPLRDVDVIQLQEWLQRQGLPRVAIKTVHQAVTQRAREASFHPVRQLFEGLEWDQTPRLSTALKIYFGATGEEEYLMQIGRMFFISIVARIFRPGCKCDYMVVLEGEQGILKSLACKVLAGGEAYFSDCLPNIHGKDASQHLRGKLIIEVSEWAAFSKAESEHLKTFISRTHEKYRPPYGHLDVAEPRQCVFIGTTNEDSYLKDPTGGRRFWPVKTGTIDIAALERDRDQLFAEAVNRYWQEEQWWPDAEFEKRYIKPEQEDRYERDPWEGPIAEHLKGKLKTYVLDIARKGLGFDADAKVGTRDQRRIIAVLTVLGWRRGKHDEKGNPYEAPKAPAEAS